MAVERCVIMGYVNRNLREKKMQMFNSTHTKNILKVILIILLSICIIFCVFYFFTHNLSYRNSAKEYADYIVLNGAKYEGCSLENIDYNISNIVICKTDMGKKLYMIEEYPDYEYIAVYSAWDGSIYHKVQD